MTYLALEIPSSPHGEHHDRNAQEGGAQRLAQLAQMEGVGGRVAVAFLDGGVEAEELRDGDADAGEGEGGAEPG